MRRIIGFGQVLEIKPRVNLRGADVGVAEQLLHGTQIAAGLQYVAGKRVAQHVRVNRHRQARLQAARSQALPDRLRSEPRAVLANEECL